MASTASSRSKCVRPSQYNERESGSCRRRLAGGESIAQEATRAVASSKYLKISNLLAHYEEGSSSNKSDSEYLKSLIDNKMVEVPGFESGYLLRLAR
jgi:hypothetical protein